jgi:hypothetical protein
LPLAPKRRRIESNHKVDDNVGHSIDNDAEHAAWLAVKSMVEIAERHWIEEEDKANAQAELEAQAKVEANHAVESEDTDSQQSEFQKESSGLRLSRIVSEDTSIVGDLFRAMGNTIGNVKERQPQAPLVRFRDETWQELYGVVHELLIETHRSLSHSVPAKIPKHILNLSTPLHRMLRVLEQKQEKVEESEPNDQEKYCAAVHDKETVALVMGFVFGTPAIPATLLTRELMRTKLNSVARACQAIGGWCDDPSYKLSQSRSCLLTLRMADMGFWDEASELLTSRSSFDRDNKKDNNVHDESTLLSIDGMIYASTYLIDRMYSQTYVRHGIDTDELDEAVRLGRKAVEMASLRYEALPADTTHTPTGKNNESDRDAKLPATIQHNHHQYSHQHQHQHQQQQQQPPPPVTSLFANDDLRYGHAKLALGKALSLLAQHIGLGATNPCNLRVEPLKQDRRDRRLLPNDPELAAEDQRMWELAGDVPHMWELASNVPHPRKRIEWTESFFEESRRHLSDGLKALEQRAGGGRNCSTNGSLLSLRAALESAEAERNYCFASASCSMDRTLRMKHHGLSAMAGFSKAFSKTMEGCLKSLSSSSSSSSNLSEHKETEDLSATLDVLVRCGKDLGKARDFCDHYGVDWRSHVRQLNGTIIDIQWVFDFAHLLSIHKHGSHHPTTENIVRLSKFHRLGEPPQPLPLKYLAVAAWLVKEYGSGV